MKKLLTRFELLLWSFSVLVITASFILSKDFDYTVLTASLIGATALIFVAKGNPLGQILTVVFACFYGYISIKFCYWGEMITYLFMTAPMAIAATVSWLKNPSKKGRGEVKVAAISRKTLIWLFVSSIVVTVIFYFILSGFNTPNIFFSTISITTSFLASGLTFFRNPYYALAYAANDVILIILWTFASIEQISYLPKIACFVIYLFNDLYGFINWKRMEKNQNILL